MKRFVDGVDRSQGLLLPDRLEDFVHEDNPVRVVDAFVEALDLSELGFEAANRVAGGRPAYHPAVLLKIYIYGYLNRIQSSRRLEREAQRNLELIWLTGRLAPDFKTIADFRKDNGAAITAVCSRFVALCRSMKVFSHAIVAIDGSKLKAVNSRDRNFTVGKVRGRRQQLEESVARYLAELDRADRDPALLPEGRAPHLKDKLAKLRAQMEKLDAIEKQLEAAPDHQISLTDPDARSMTSSGRGTGTVGYNVQAVVDAKHHLIVAHDVTNDGHDRAQLSRMATKAREALGTERMTALADRGYFNAPEILACEEAGVIPLVPKPLTSNSKAEGRFDKRDFIYDEAADEYECPAGERAIHRFTAEEKGLTLHKYWSSACPRCPMRMKCTTASYRRITRWEHEHVLERMQMLLDARPQAAVVRRQTVEHVFGTLKSWLGTTPLLTKTLPKVRSEVSLAVLAYNMKRMIKIVGTQGMVRAIAA
ncbi:IS1182 family transposase [Solilutibacter oculi]|uniref:IS1182 family transposase n=2 Tax=Gammaproteobacteria TaxID=1236 RepID=A0A344J886_9GAMM|nr:IS1182 family transposase [Lysobacter oculi]AXA85246.1 IS1182 family transposase [Lysobacter oculi]AXA85257.1 IS1182 family transposase [Lysobacter oculi]